MSDAHVDEITWEKLAMNELTPQLRADTLRHVMQCPRCRTIYRGVRALEDAVRADGLLPEQVMPGRKPSRRWIGIAAGVAAAAAVLLIVVTRPDRPSDVVRGGHTAVVSVEIAASVRTGDRVTWAAVASADGYRVEVFAEDGTPAWSGDTAATELAWPAAPKPGVYRVRIEALAKGTVLARSPLIRVEVAR